MLAIVGPSASGKSAIVKLLESKYGMEKFVTCTTRYPRFNEIDKKDYYFLTKEAFNDLYEKGEFIETVFYNGNYYGSLKKEIKDNKVVILEPRGLKAFSQKISDLFVVYLETEPWLLAQRMKMRGDSELEIEKRLQNDAMIFIKNELSIDLIINTTNLSLDEITKKVYDAYTKKGQ